MAKYGHPDYAVWTGLLILKFFIAVSQSKVAWLTPNLRILLGCIHTWCPSTSTRAPAQNGAVFRHWVPIYEGPLYLLWKHFHAKVIGLFTHHGKFEKQFHVHRKKASNHVSRKNTNHIHVAQAYIQIQSLQMYLNISVVFHVLNVCISWLCE